MKLDSKKIESALKRLAGAGKAAVDSLNEMTDGDFKGGDLEKDPINSLGQIVRVLQNAQATALKNARYEGMTPEEVDEAQAAERVAEKEELQKMVQGKLLDRQKVEEPAEESVDDLADDQPESNS